MNIIERIMETLKQNEKKTIVLSETEDSRIIEAASEILKLNFANLILVGNKEKIANDFSQYDLSSAVFINPENYEKKGQMIELLYELRKNKGMMIEQAQELVNDYTYFATMLVKMGEADGIVCGATHSTANTLRPALQIIKTSAEAKIVTSFSIMELSNCKYSDDGIYFFADTGLVENPTAEELSEIAIQTAKTYKKIMNKEPKVAMLSYSTLGSAKGELPNKVIEATKIVKEKMPELIIDGEMQLDAAIVDTVAKMKAPNSVLKGDANVLIFPDLNAGNISYKLVERFGGANAYGPITQGMAKPVNDLSRGCKAYDIVGAVAITCLQVE